MKKEPQQKTLPRGRTVTLVSKKKPPLVTSIIVKKSSLKNYERHLMWEKKSVEKEMNQVIMSKAIPLAKKLIDAGLEGNVMAINSLFDRVFGKARQNIGLDGGAEDKPIVFMPAQLLEKYALNNQAQELLTDGNQG